MAGIWVGLAVQAKMVEAWLVVPALALMILVASAGPLRRRMVQVAAMAVVVVAASFSWMLFVTLSPASFICAARMVSSHAASSSVAIVASLNWIA